MNAILLCAGFGTRLRPLTEDQPKALVEIAGRPLVDYLMDQLVHWEEIEAIHVVHNARHPTGWAQWCDGWEDRAGRSIVTLHNNGVRASEERNGAVGDLQFVLRRIGTEVPAVVAAGDSLYRISLCPVMDRFNAVSGHCVLALAQPDEERLRQSSVLELNGNRVCGVVHESDDRPSGWISPAFYALQPSGLAHVQGYLARGGDNDTLGRFIDDLAQHQRVDAVKLRGPTAQRLSEDQLRYHVNTPDEHARANAMLAEESILLEETI